MAASAFSIYNIAKKYLNDGTVDLDTNVIKGYLAKGSSGASTFTLSTIAGVTNPVAGGGYKGAVRLSAAAVLTQGSAKQYIFDSTALVYSASGANITSIKYLVIAVSGGKAIAWCRLSSTTFSVTTGNKLTVTPPASGWFTIN
jgi:hypothetical protein